MTKAKSYTGDDGIERCMDCDGFLPESFTSDPRAKCARCSNRKKKAKADAKAEVVANGAAEKKAAKEKAEAEQVRNWRRNTIGQLSKS